MLTAKERNGEGARTVRARVAAQPKMPHHTRGTAYASDWPQGHGATSTNTKSRLYSKEAKNTRNLRFFVFFPEKLGQCFFFAHVRPGVRPLRPCAKTAGSPPAPALPPRPPLPAPLSAAPHPPPRTPAAQIDVFSCPWPWWLSRGNMPPTGGGGLGHQGVVGRREGLAGHRVLPGLVLGRGRLAGRAGLASKRLTDGGGRPG
jgi:hypothetical protein